MPRLKAQINHPGLQKTFEFKKGYCKIRGRIIRKWNNDKSHYRKFILNRGAFLDDIVDVKPKNSNLFFWGEWEGNSFFHPINNNNYQILPNGIHKPFHSIVNRGGQNTDPYIFGKHFKYCICKQTGTLCDLDTNSLLLFGSVYPRLGKFYIDTVFVVKNHTTALHVQLTGARRYSKIYKDIMPLLVFQAEQPLVTEMITRAIVF